MSAGINIVFSSHNGARTLPRMLAALERLNPPKRGWRVLAVDNASTDETPALFAAASRRLPLTALSCPTPGKMPALKHALRHATGDLIVFTDDDVEPDPDWLVAYEAAADANGTIGLFGGPIRPTPMEPVSPWYQASARHHAELFARSDQPDGPVDAGAHVYGPNFMIRSAYADVLDQVAPGLGPTFAGGRAKSFPMGEDTMIMDILQRRGAGALYVRASGVNHLVRAFQTDLAFMLARAERHGRGGAIRYVEEGGRSPLRRARMAVTHGLAALKGAPPAAEISSPAFEALWRARWSRGAMQGALFGPWTS